VASHLLIITLSLPFLFVVDKNFSFVLGMILMNVLNIMRKMKAIMLVLIYTTHQHVDCFRFVDC